MLQVQETRPLHDDDESVKEKKSTSKKWSNFMNHRQHNKKKANENEGNTSDEEEESSDDEDYNCAFLQHDVTCSIQDKAAIPKTWILLDSKLTVDMFSNPKIAH